MSGNQLASGLYDLRFGLYDSAQGGNLLAALRTNTATLVSTGLLTATLDFGTGVFGDVPRWLEVAVRTNGITGAFLPLTPRQALRPTPTATYAGNAGRADLVGASGVQGTLGFAQLPPSLLTNGARNVDLVGTFSGNGRSLSNVAAVTAQSVPALSLVTLARESYPNQSAPLELPMADGTNAVTHFSLWDCVTNWNGYRFLGVGTPYPTAGRERPHFWVSQNGVNWVTPPGATNPIINGTYADTSVIVNRYGDAVVYTAIGSNLFYITTRDGIHWTRQTRFTTNFDGACPIPVVMNDGSVLLYAQRQGYGHVVPDGGSYIVRFRADDTGTNFSSQYELLNGLPPTGWHFGIQRRDGWFHLLANLNVFGGSPFLRYYLSQDGLQWSKLSEAAFGLSQTGLADGSTRTIYWPAFLPEPGGRWTMYSSAAPPRVNSSVPDPAWRIYRTTNVLFYISPPVLSDGSMSGAFGGTITNHQAGVSLNGEFNGSFTGVINEAQSWGTFGLFNPALNLVTLTPEVDADGMTPTLTLRAEAGAAPTWFVGSATNVSFGVPLRGNGSGLTNLSAGALTSGVVPDTALAANIAQKSATNTWLAAQSFQGRVGVGATAPKAQLHLKQTPAETSPGLRIESSTGVVWTIWVDDDGSLVLDPGGSARPIRFAGKEAASAAPSASVSAGEIQALRRECELLRARLEQLEELDRRRTETGSSQAK